MKTNMMLNGIVTVLWEKWVEFKFEWKKITASALVSPMLYMIAANVVLTKRKNL